MANLENNVKNESNAMKRFRLKVNQHHEEMTLKYGPDFLDNQDYKNYMLERNYPEFVKKIEKASLCLGYTKRF